MLTARIIVTGTDAHAVVPYDLRHIAKSFGARWEPTEKTWKLPVSRVETLAGALRATGAVVFITYKDGTPWTAGSSPAAPRTAPRSWADERLTKAHKSNPELPARLHRALSRVLHPDAGGCPALMVELNTARDRLVA